MKRWLGSLIAAAFLILSPAAHAANSTVSAMTAASALGGTELLYVVQGGADRKGTPAQFATYIYGLASGDCTISGVGAVVCTKTNGVAFTAAATTAIGTSGATIPLLSTANTWTLGQTFSAAPTFGSITGSTQCLHVNSSGLLSGTGSDCGAGGGSGTVTSVSAGCGTSTGGSPITTTGTVSSALTLRSNTAATDTIVSTDCGNAVYENRATSVAVAIAQAGTAGFGAGAYFLACNINAGVATITPTTSTIGGAATLAIPAGTAAAPVCYGFQSDGTNYNIVQTPLFNVAGTAVMGTSAISSATCASAVTVSAPGVLTTDTILWGFNGDPTAITGFVPLVAGMLTIIAYPTANNINFKECNNTSSSVTPGAHTLNWKVVR